MIQVYLPLDPIERAERRKRVIAAASKRWRQNNRERVAANKRAYRKRQKS